MREIQNDLINFIREKGSEEDFQKLKEDLLDYKIFGNKEELIEFLCMISNISTNNHNYLYFFRKIENILIFLKENITEKLTNYEIFRIFMKSKRILLFLIRENIMMLDKSIILKMKKYEYLKYFEYFTPEIKSFIESNHFEDDELLKNVLLELPEDFEANREIGENESYICKLIRNDSVKEFISYVNRENLYLESTINQSIYETNAFLLLKIPSLIEYAAFFGSIQIFQYLRFNNVHLTSLLYNYAVFGQNAEIIHILEENRIELDKEKSKKCFMNALKYYHNDFAHYINDTFLFHIKEEEEFEITAEAFSLHNYLFFSDDFNRIKISLYYLCKKKCFRHVELYFKHFNVDFQYFFDINDYKKIDLPKFEVYQNKITAKNYIIKSSKNDIHNVQDIPKLFQIKYPALLEIKGYSPIGFNNRKRTTILTEYYKNGSLASFLTKIENENSNESTKKYILILGIAIGMKYLNDHNIVHRYFHPNNVIIDDNCYPLICDFEYPIESTYEPEFNLPVHWYETIYCAPETFDSLLITPLSNVYSYSLIVYRIITGKNPFEKHDYFNNFTNIKMVLERNPCDVSLVNNECIVNFLETYSSKDQLNRYTIDDVINEITNEDFYSFFESLDHESVKKYLDVFGNEFVNLKSKF